MTQTKLIGQCDVLADDRAIVTFHAEEPGEAPLWMELYDSRRDYPAAILGGLRQNGYFDETEGNGLYRIPLGITHTVDIGDTSSPDAGITHIKPVRFASPEGDRLAALRDGGRLYLFINGHLWREIAVSGGGDTFRDINLARYQGEDQRPGSDGMETEPGAITVPYRMNGDPPLIQIAYSEIPWSWAYIETLGGLADDDPRYLPDLAAHKPYATHRQNVDHELRMQRTTALNLSDFSDDYSAEQIKQTNLLVAGTVDNHYNQPEPGVPCALPGLTPMDVEDRLIIAALPDPLGIALDTVADIQLDLDELKQHLEDINNDEHAQSAVYAYQVFFNEALHDKSWQVHNASDLLRRYREYNYTDQSESAQALREAAARLSETAIKETLRTEPRQRLRDRIRTNRQALANWLRDKDSQGHDASEGYDQFLSLSQALLDYAWLPVPSKKDLLDADPDSPHTTPDYSALWVRLSDLLDGADDDPALYDGGYNIEDPGAPRLDEDGMDTFISDLLNTPDHPLHAALFPNEQQVPDDQPFQGDPDQALATVTGPQFRPDAFAALSGGLPGLEYLRKSQAQMDTIMGSLLLRFQRQWTQAIEQQQTQQMELFARFGKASGHPTMSDLRVAARNQVPEGYEVVKVETSQRYLSLKEEQQQLKTKPGAQNAVRIFKPGTQDIIGSTSIHDVSRNRGTLMGLAASGANAIKEVGFRQLLTRQGMQQALDLTLRSDIQETTVKQIIRPKVDDLTRELHGESTGNPDAGIKARAINTANKALPPFMAVLEVVNLHAIVQRSAKGQAGAVKTISDSLYSVTALTYALLDTSIRLAGEDRTVRGLEALIKHKAAVRQLGNLIEGSTGIWGTGGAEFSNFKLAGAGLALAGSILALVEVVRQSNAGNRGSALAHGVETVAMLGLTASLTGQAMIKAAVKRTFPSRLFFVAGPWGWAFMAVAFTAAIIAERLKLSELERWAAFGPFSSDPEDRMTQEYENLDGHTAHLALLSQLMMPHTRIQAPKGYDTPVIQVDIETPGIGADTPLEHHLFRVHSDGTQEELLPTTMEPILADNDDPLTRVGLRVWYPRHNDHEPIHLRLQTRLKSESIDDWLPQVAKGESKKIEQGNTTRYCREGWHYTECRLHDKPKLLLSPLIAP